ncbi:hypothetical protein, partial [Caloranaerobacter sp. DY30410]|uniref:hypothetical protein n=1 Tax=Caloranaerobacter sp. DY30410 TaxID=3238305 RepID=UPI003D02F5B1
NPLSLNLYTYCKGNPIKYTDPEGHNPIIVLMLWATAIASSPDTQMDIQFISMDLAEENYLAALLDTAGMLIPVATGIGKIGDDAVKFVKNGLDDIGKTSKRLFNIDLQLFAKGTRKLIKFKGDEAVIHFEKHGKELMDAFGKDAYNLKNYIDDANHVINNGTYVKELNGYVKLIGGKGSAKYGFVGLDRATGNITTFHIKTASELSKKAPSLGILK